MAAFWFVLVGVLLVAIALLGRFLDRLPVSPAMIYLLVGFALGPAVFNVLELHPLRELTLLETITEIALLIALFTVGIKMRVPIGDWRWSVPLRLATISMVLTILGIAIAAMVMLGFDWPAGAGARRGARAHRSGAGLGRAAAQRRRTATACASASRARAASTMAPRFRSSC